MSDRETTGTGRLGAIASARRNDERSTETWSRYADAISGHEDGAVRERVIRNVGGKESRRVLDLGAGAGSIVGLYAGPGRDVVGWDLPVATVERPRSRADRDGADVRFARGDAASLPVEADRFDVATSRVVIRSLPNRGVAVREWFRVFRSGGTMGLGDGTRRERNDAKTDLPFRPVPPSKIRASFDAVGLETTRVVGRKPVRGAG